MGKDIIQYIIRNWGGGGESKGRPPTPTTQPKMLHVDQNICEMNKRFTNMRRKCREIFHLTSHKNRKAKMNPRVFSAANWKSIPSDLNKEAI